MATRVRWQVQGSTDGSRVLSAVYRSSVRWLGTRRGDRPATCRPLNHGAAVLPSPVRGRGCDQTQQSSWRSRTGPSERGAQEGGRGCRCPSRASLRWARPDLRDNVGRLGVRAMTTGVPGIRAARATSWPWCRHAAVTSTSAASAVRSGWATGVVNAWLPRDQAVLRRVRRGRHWWSRSVASEHDPAGPRRAPRRGPRGAAGRSGPARRGSAATAGARRRRRRGRRRSGGGSHPPT